MKTRLTEDQIIMEAIHKNCVEQRKFNVKREKKAKKEMLVNNILMFVSSGIFFIGLMYLIAVVENMKF